MQSKLVSSLMLSTVSADMLKASCYNYGEKWWSGVLLDSKKNTKYLDCGQDVCPSLCPTFSYNGY